MKTTPQQKARYQRWYQANKAAQLAYERARYAANPEPIKARVKKWCQSNHIKDRAIQNRRRSRMLGDATSTDVQQIMDASDSVCSYCLKVVDSLEIEHCIPLSRGGFHDVSNIVPACAPCNRRKGPRTVLEFLL